MNYMKERFSASNPKNNPGTYTLGIISPKIDDLYAVLAVNLNYALNIIKQQAYHESLSLPYHSHIIRTDLVVRT